MPLHNWYFGGVFVPFSANIESEVLKLTPLDYGRLFYELLHFNFETPLLPIAYRQALNFPPEFIGQSGGPLGFYLSIPVHCAAVVIVIAIAASRRFDPWLRLTAGAALAQHSVALFYGGAIRYFFLAWFLTMLVAAVWCEQVGAEWFAQRWPHTAKRIGNFRPVTKLAAWFD